MISALKLAASAFVSMAVSALAHSAHEELSDTEPASAFFLAQANVEQVVPSTGPSATRAGGGPPTRLAVSALDLNKDGVIDADEIAKATASLKALDKNGDGKLSADEYRAGPGGGGDRPQQAAATPAPALTAAPAAAPATSRTETGKPNVIVFVADDLGWGDVGFHKGNVPTPNLDRLAKEGVELQRFYVHPVCSPTRAALLSGQMPRRFGINDVMGPGQALPAGLTTLPGTFRSAGYATSLVGKWHLGKGSSVPQQFGFDHFYGFLGPEIDYFKHTSQRGDVDWQRDGTTLNEEGYSTFLFADEAIRQLEKRDAKKPFYMQVAFNAVHVPLSAPDDLLAKYKNLGGQATSAAVLDAMDTSIGKILAALDKEKLRENTIVVFFSDNGASRRNGSNGAFRAGKGTLYEGGIHTPCIIRWPGRIAPGTASHQPVAVFDLFPTLAAAAGIKNDAKLDGFNVWPALQNGRVEKRPAFAIANADIALIDGDWKLIESSTGERALYNLATDISESKDELSAQPETASRLIAQVESMKKDLPAASARRGGPGGRPGPRAQGGAVR